MSCGVASCAGPGCGTGCRVEPREAGAGPAAYYVDTVARGAEEYYTGAKEAPGVWVGAGSGLGLAGEVDGETLGTCCGMRIRRDVAADLVAVGADGRRVRRDVLCAEVGVVAVRAR